MKNKKTALTLVEMMISIVLLAVVIGQVFQAFGLGNKLWDVNSNQLVRQKDARNVASWLARDIRALTSTPASVRLSADGDNMSLDTAAGNIQYSLEIDGDKGVLKRAGSPIGQHIQSLNLTVGSSAVDIDVVTYTETALSGTQTYQLQTKVRRRNDD